MIEGEGSGMSGEAGFAALYAGYTDRLAAAQACSAGGGVVIGSVGAGMPRELPIALGMMPLEVAPMPRTATPHADQWVSDSFDPLLRPVFDDMIGGAVEFLDLLVIVSRHERDVPFYHNAKEVLRLEPSTPLPPLHLLVMLAHPYDECISYGQDQIKLLLERLEAMAGRKATADDLRHAAEVVNRERRALARLEGLRRRGVVTGREALVATGARAFLEPAFYIAAIEAFLADREDAVSADPKRRVLVVSSLPLATLDVHTLVEEAGGYVVGEDDRWGSRAESDLLTDDPTLNDIFALTHHNLCSRSVFRSDLRLNWYAQAVTRPDIDDVLFFMPKTDRVLGWDFPRMRDMATAAGKPVLLIDDDLKTAEGRAAATATCRARLSSKERVDA